MDNILIGDVLEDLLGKLTPEKLAELRKTLCGSEPVTRTKKVVVKQAPVTRYISFEMNIICKNCGSSKVVKKQVEPREVVHTLTSNDIVVHTVIDKSCTLTNHTKCCDECLRFAKQLSREELEQAYINLLKGV